MIENIDLDSSIVKLPTDLLIKTFSFFRRYEISIDTTKFPEVSYSIISRMSAVTNNRLRHFSSVAELVAEYKTTGMGLIREKNELPAVSNDQSEHKYKL